MLPKSSALALSFLLLAGVFVITPVAAVSDCTITSPTPGATFSIDDPAFTVSVSTSDGSSVQFGHDQFSNDFTDFSAPFQYQYDPGTLGQGHHELKAVCHGSGPSFAAQGTAIVVEDIADAPVLENVDVFESTKVALVIKTLENVEHWRIYDEGTFVHEIDSVVPVQEYLVTNVTASTEHCYTVTVYGGPTLTDDESDESNEICVTPSTGGNGPTDFVDNNSGATAFDYTSGVTVNGNRYEVSTSTPDDRRWIGVELAGTAGNTSVEVETQWVNGGGFVDVVLSKQNIGVDFGTRSHPPTFVNHYGHRYNSVGATIRPVSSDTALQIEFWSITNGVKTFHSSLDTGFSPTVRREFNFHFNLDDGEAAVRDLNDAIILTSTIPSGGAVYAQWYTFDGDSGGGSSQVYLFRDAGSTTVDDGIIESSADPPTAPQNLVLTPGPNSVDVEWDAPVSDGGEAISQYDVYFDGHLSGTVTPPTTSVTLNNIFDQELHTIGVTASNGAGEGPAVEGTINADLPESGTANFVDAGTGATRFNYTDPFGPSNENTYYEYDGADGPSNELGADLTGTSNVYTATVKPEVISSSPDIGVFISTQGQTLDFTTGDSRLGVNGGLGGPWLDGAFMELVPNTATNTWYVGVGQIVNGDITVLDDRVTQEATGVVQEFSLLYDAQLGVIEARNEDGVSLARANTSLLASVGSWLEEFTYGPGLLLNGGFETYTTSPGVPDDWGDIGTGHTNEEETTLERTGNNALKITGDGSNRGGVAQTLTGLVTGKSYYVEAWARTDGVAGEVPILVIRNIDDAVSLIQEAGTDAGTTYERLSSTFYVDDDADEYSIRVQVEATGTNPVVYFDDVSVKEIIATDSSGEDNHGTLRGATNTAGPTPGATDPWGGSSAMEFDGVDDYVSIPDDNSLDITDAITLEAWINIDDMSTARAFLNKGSAFYFDVAANGAITMGIFGLSDETLTTPASTLGTGTWNHVVGTYDGANTRIYVDAVEVASEATTGTIDSTAGDFHIGRRGSEYMDGRIAGANVYDRALTPAEISLRYEHGAAPTLADSFWVTGHGIGSTGVSGNEFHLHRDSLSAVSGGSLGTTIVPPTAPPLLEAEPDDQRVDLSWDVPLNNGGENIIQYRGWVNGNVSFEVPGTQLNFQVLGLTNDVEYTFKVQARNTAGYGPNATVTGTPVASGAVGGQGSTPGVPRSVIVASPFATNGDAFFAASWLPPAGGVALHPSEPYHWIVTKQFAGGFVVGEGTANALTVNDRVASSTSTYCFHVAAQGIGGASTRSNYTEPQCLTNIQAPDEDNQFPFVTISSHEDGDVVMAGEVITLTASATDSDGAIVDVSWSINNPQPKYGVDNVQTSHPYPFQYEVQEGTGQMVVTAMARDNGAFLTVETIILDVVNEVAGSHPSRVTNLTQTRIPGGYEVTWDAPESDGGEAITDYNVYREIGDNFRIQGTFSIQDVLNPGNESTYIFHDNEADGSDNYCWAVTAKNSVGASPFVYTCVEGDRTVDEEEEFEGNGDGTGGAGGGSPFDLNDAADGSGISVSALGWIMATIITVALAGGMAFLVQGSMAPYMGVFGILAGIGLSFAFGWIPAWFIVLLALFGAGAVFMGVRGRVGSGE